MDKDDALFQMLRDLREGHDKIQKVLGRLEQGQESLDKYIGAVSQNTKEIRYDLVSHKDDDGAHGIKTIKWLLGGVISVIGGVVGLLEWFRSLHKNGG